MGILQRRLAAVLGDRVVVSSPRLLTDQAATAVAALRTGLLTVSILALTVAGFVVFNTMSMAALERRRELATLRALGGRRRGLLVSFLAEAALLGLVGAAGGAAIASVAARSLVSRIPTQIVAAFDLRIGYILPTDAVAAALAAGTGLAMFAAFLPARRAVRVPPVEAMRPEGVLEASGDADRPRWVVAIAGFTTMTVGLVLAVAAGAVVAIGMFWVGGLVGMYGIAGPQARAASWLAGRFRTAGRLGAASLARNPRRVYATAATVTAAVALVVGQTGTERNVNASVRSANESVARTDLIVTTATPENLASDLLLSDPLATSLSKVPGVKTEALEQRAFAYVGADRIVLHGVTGPASVPMLSPAPLGARRAMLAGAGLVVTSQFAKPRHLRAGDTFYLPTPTGAQRVTVLAVTNTFASVPGGDITLSLQHLQTWFARPGLSQIELTLQPDADETNAERAVSSLLRSAAPGAHVETGAQNARRLQAAGAQVAGAFNAIELIIILGAGLAVLNTLAISVVERRRELGILRAVGTSRKQLRRGVLAEAAGIGAIGAAAGLVFGVPAHYMAVLGTKQVGGIPVAYHFDPRPLVLAAVAAVALTMLGSVAPAVRTGRLNVIEAIGYE